MPRWETNGVFFALNQTIQSTGKVRTNSMENNIQHDCYVDGLYEMLGEYESLDELNYLASKIDELDEHDYNHFQAAMQVSDYTGSIKDLINLIDNLDKYEIYPGVENYADLGHYYVNELGMVDLPDYLVDYFDYEDYR